MGPQCCVLEWGVLGWSVLEWGVLGCGLAV